MAARPRRLLTVLAAVLASFAAAPDAIAQEEGTILRIKGETGQIARYKAIVRIKLAAGGQTVELVLDQVERVKVASVSDDGKVTLERKVESSKQTIDGEELPDSADELSESTVVLNPDGSLADYKSDDDKETIELGLRLSQAVAPVFPEAAVKPGSKWSHTHPALSKYGTKAGTSEYEYLADEQAAGSDCAKVRLAYKEAVGGGIESKATLWVEKSSGDVVKSEFEYKNVPFPGGGEPAKADASGTTERTEGSLVSAEGVAPAEEQEKPKTIDEVTKGFEKIPGQFTFYRKDEDGSLELLMEVPVGLLGKDLMLQTTASTGDSATLVGGDPVSDLLFQLQELRKGYLTLVVPNRLFRARSGLEIQKAVQRSFADSHLEQFEIKARQEDRGSVLIDVGEFFLGDISQLGDRFSGGGGLAELMGGGGRRMSLDSASSFVTAVKSFPENAVVEALFNFKTNQPAGLQDLVNQVSPDLRSTVVRVLYNLWAVPDSGDYVPRPADSRLGYFTVSFQDLSRDRERNQARQWINRWNLRKKDPSAAVSEPVRPIVFWLDPSIPAKYRGSVRDSLLVWNKALEKAGFKDAVQVKEPSADEAFDSTDVRFNAVRWVASPGSAYAVANFRVHPSTGEILNADILVDANIMRAATGEIEGEITPAQRQSPYHCDCLRKSADFVAFGLSAARELSEPGTFDEDSYIRQFLEAFVIHEMGHILGLRHNFVASTQLTAAELGDKEKVERHSTAASTMDYVPFNPWALGKDGVAFYGPGLGDYDFWAIQYGYGDFGEPGSRAEANALAAWAARGNEPGLAYQSDEAVGGFDPYVSQFDLGADPLLYWSKTLATAKRLMATLGDRSPGPGQSYYDFTSEYKRLIRVMRGSASQMTRFVGGLRASANRRGDPGEVPTLAPVPGPVQREALKSVVAGVLAPGSVTVPKGYLSRFAPNPDAGLIESFVAGADPHNALDELAGVPIASLNALMGPELLGRVVNNEFKSASADKFTLRELFDTLDSAVWTELESGKEIDPVRRALQRKHVETLSAFVVSPPPGLPEDARMLALRSLKQLGVRVAAAGRTAPGPYGKPHLEDMLTRIARALNAVQTVGAARGGAPSLLELLGGG